jgi:lysophospholipase L1-like esterase
MYTPNMFNLSKPPEYPYSGYQVIGVDFGNWNGSACTSYDTYYLNGVALPGTYITPGCSGGRATTGNFFIGPAPAGPGSGPNWQGTQYIFPGSLYSMALYSANLGASGQATAAAAFRAKNNAGGALIVPSSPNIASPRNYCIGDSITAGYSSYLTLTPYCQIVPAQLNGVPFTSTVLNAISGITTAADIASEAYRTAPNCQTPSGPSYASLLTGTNDFLFFTSDTGQTVYSKNAQEAHILKFFGCRVVVGSMLSRGGWNGTVPAATACTTFELCKNALNPLLSSGVANGAFDGYIDYASHVGLGADGASTKTLWRASYAYVSGVGYQIIDSNGNLESLTTAGTSGSTQPTWCITVSCTNTDGGAVWTVTQLAPVGRCHTAASTTPAFGGTAACFQYDETHPTQAGQQELANIYANVYNRIFGYSALNPRVISSGSTYQMLPADGAITYTGASTFTLTLPDCTGMTGLTFTIADTVDEAVTINAMGSTQPINGLLNISLGGNDSAVLTATANPYSTSGCHWSY